MTPEELANTFPLPILEAALEIKEMEKPKIDLSKIPDDVLDMAIEKKEMELVKESINESKSKMEAR